jgi:PilZ domain
MQNQMTPTTDFFEEIKSSRRFPRKKIELPTGMVNGNAIINGSIVDIGPGGVRIITRDFVPGEGQTVTIQFRIDAYANWGYLQGKVVWVENNYDAEQGDTVSFGLEWGEHSGFDERWLWFLRFPYFPN